jgi:hypothetical protein
MAQLASSPAAQCCWLPCPARVAHPWRPPALKLPAMRHHTAIRGPYQLGWVATARCRWSSVVVAAWLAGQRSSAVAGDGEARRAGVLVRRRGSGDRKARRVEVLVRHSGSGDGKARRWRCSCGGAAAATWSDALGQRGMASSDRGERGSRCRAGASEATVGAMVARARRSGDERRGRGGRGQAGAGERGNCRDSGFKLWHGRGVWRPHGSGAVLRGPGVMRGV